MPRRTSARAIADVGQGLVLAGVDIPAPPERVFEALTRADDVVRWWGSDDTYRTTEWSMPLTPGAAWRSSGEGEAGASFSVEGEILEVDAPHRLVWTWRAPWDAGHTTTITTRLEPIERGTRVTVRHEGFGERRDACHAHAEGWERVLARLAQHEPIAAPKPRYFFLRLVPPRATFPADMSASEGAAMREHAAYWRRHASAGTAILFGPVADPSGVWGLGTVEAHDEAEARALADGDPVIRADLGFRFDVLPPLSGFTR